MIIDAYPVNDSGYTISEQGTALISSRAVSCGHLMQFIRENPDQLSSAWTDALTAHYRGVAMHLFDVYLSRESPSLPDKLKITEALRAKHELLVAPETGCVSPVDRVLSVAERRDLAKSASLRLTRFWRTTHLTLPPLLFLGQEITTLCDTLLLDKRVNLLYCPTDSPTLGDLRKRLQEISAET